MITFDRLIKGFTTFVYTDHKNNLFYDSVIDNRRRSKKMSNWVLELSKYDIHRVWIRGEANILVIRNNFDDGSDGAGFAAWEWSEDERRRFVVIELFDRSRDDTLSHSDCSDGAAINTHVEC